MSEREGLSVSIRVRVSVSVSQCLAFVHHDPEAHGQRAHEAEERGAYV